MATSRYYNLKKKIDSNGKKVYETFPYIKIENLFSVDDIIIKIKESDRLDTIALKYLGDGRYWWAIALLNNIKFPFGNEVYPGRTIRIPKSIDSIITYINNNI